MKKILKDALIIATFKSVPEIKRQPMLIVLIFFVSALPLFFIYMFGGKINFGVIGAMVSTVSFMGITGAIQEIAWDRYVKIREMLVAMPVKPISYGLGISLTPLIFSIPSLVFFIGISIYLGIIPLYSIGWVIIALLLCWATLSCLGFLISTYLYKTNIFTLNIISNLLALILIFIPPVYYSEEMLGSLRWVSPLVPTSNIAGLIGGYTGMLTIPLYELILRWSILLIMMILSIVAVLHKAQWREK